MLLRISFKTFKINEETCGPWVVTKPKIPRYACIVPTDLINGSTTCSSWRSWNGHDKIKRSVPMDMCQGQHPIEQPWLTQYVVDTLCILQT